MMIQQVQLFPVLNVAKERWKGISESDPDKDSQKFLYISLFLSLFFPLLQDKKYAKATVNEDIYLE